MFRLLLLTAGLGIALAFNIDDSKGLGRRFDGIGGLSGGGATSRLLPSYPQTQRDQILDILFKPNFAASLHILKVEIGGDAQTTDGTESSHMHTQDDLNYNRGYEWWLMQEAKKRNPAIKLYGLPWAFPSWVGQGTGNPYAYPDLTSKYIVNWITGAKSVYNLTIDYVGIWNERNYDSNYIKTLRQALNTAGFQSTQIVASDSGWENIASNILSDPDLAAAVSIIGAHYPGTDSDSNAEKTGKQLWASEDYSTYNDLTGGGCWARILNQNFVNGNMTSTISWNLIAAYYPGLPYYRDGLMTATSPWSGHYDYESPIWGSAHTTQFSQPGWNYLPVGSGSGHLANGGSYVSLVNPQTKDISIIIEKMSHDHSVCIRPALPAYNTSDETATFVLGGSFASIKTLHVWYTQHNFTNEDSSIFFEKQADISVNNGQFSIQIKTDALYTITTTTGQQKGVYTGIPADVPFPTTYTDNFESYPVDSEANYFADQAGVWEIYDTSPDSHGKVMRQVVQSRPIVWADDLLPVSVIGDDTWVSHDVTVDGYFTAAGQKLFIGAGVQGTTHPSGIFFSIGDSGSWTLTDNVEFVNPIDSGSTTAPGALKWFTLRLVANKTNARGYLNGNQVFSTTISGRTGWAAIGTNAYYQVLFDNFNLVGQQINCGTSVASGQEVELYPCTSGSSAATQAWVLNSDGTISSKGSSNLCFDASGKDPNTGAPDIFLATCNNTSDDQKFTVNGSRITQTSTGLCLDVAGQSTSPGTHIELWSCNGGSNQQWTFVSSTGQLQSGLGGCAAVCSS